MKPTLALQRFLVVLGAAPLLAACGSSEGTPKSRESSAGNAAAAGMSPGGASGMTGGAGSTTGGGNGDPPAANVTRHYSWEACGTIPASTEAYDVVSASDGTFVFKHQDRIVVYDHADFSTYRELPLACSDSAFGCAGAMALSSDGAFLAQGLAIFDTAVGAFVRDLTPPDGGLCDTTHVVLSPTGDALLSFGKTGLCNFRGADGSTFTRLTGAVSHAAFDGDGLTVIEETPGSGLPIVVRYDLSGTEILRVATELLPVGLSPDGSYIACASPSEPVVGICDRDGKLLWSTEGYGTAAFSPDGSFVLLGASVFRVDSGERVAQFADRWLDHPLALAPDGRALGIAYRTGAIWFDDEPLPTSLHGHAIASDANPLRSLAMTPDGGALLSVGLEALRWRIAPVFTESVATVVSDAPYLGRGEISPDGRWAAVAGDGRVVVDLTTGAVAPSPYSSSPAATGPCIWLQLKFSPDSRFVVGSGQGRSIEVLRTEDFARVAAISTRACNVRVAFSTTTPTIMTSELVRYSTDTWRPTEQTSSSSGSSEFGPFDDIVLSEKDLNVAFSRGCEQLFEDTGEREVCRTTITGQNAADLSAVDAPFPSFSPEGHWLVAGNRLVHLPSGETRVFDENADVSIFAPNGDIVAGTRDGSLTRYCRHE